MHYYCLGSTPSGLVNKDTGLNLCNTCCHKHWLGTAATKLGSMTDVGSLSQGQVLLL